MGTTSGCGMELAWWWSEDRPGRGGGLIPGNAGPMFCVWHRPKSVSLKAHQGRCSAFCSAIHLAHTLGGGGVVINPWRGVALPRHTCPWGVLPGDGNFPENMPVGFCPPPPEPTRPDLTQCQTDLVECLSRQAQSQGWVQPHLHSVFWRTRQCVRGWGTTLQPPGTRYNQRQC